MTEASSPRPDLATLADWVEGRLDEEAAARVAAAVDEGDEATTATVGWMRRLRDVARELPQHEPPPIVRQSLGRHFARWSRARAALAHEPIELRASIRFDSRQDLALVGTRGGDDADDAVHLAYATDRADVVLDIRRAGPGCVRIDGQVLPAAADEAPIFEAVVDTPTGILRTVDGDDLGRFCLPSVPMDAAQLRVSNGDLLIVVPLRLGPEEPMR